MKNDLTTTANPLADLLANIGEVMDPETDSAEAVQHRLRGWWDVTTRDGITERARFAQVGGKNRTRKGRPMFQITHLAFVFKTSRPGRATWVEIAEIVSLARHTAVARPERVAAAAARRADRQQVSR